MFNVGDLVRVNDNYFDAYYHGAVGTVKEVHEPDSIEVVFLTDSPEFEVLKELVGSQSIGPIFEAENLREFEA